MSPAPLSSQVFATVIVEKAPGVAEPAGLNWAYELPDEVTTVTPSRSSRPMAYASALAVASGALTFDGRPSDMFTTRML